MRPSLLIVSTFLIFLFQLEIHGQTAPLSLEVCYTRAIQRNPLSGNRELYLREKELRTKNISSSYLPNAQLNAEAKYISKVIDLNGMISVPGFDIPSPPNDQYSFSLNVNQLIYDGGMGKNSKALEESGFKTREQELKVELYRLRERVNNLYFGILFQQQNDSLFRLSLNVLEAQLKRMTVAVQNGVVLPSELDVLKVEVIRLEENILTNTHNRLRGLQLLGILIDSVLPDQTIMSEPAVVIDFDAPVSRPELTLFEYQQNQIEVSKKLRSAKTTPLIFAFGQAGYGQPGLNPVNDSFDSWYMVGLRMTWKFWDWNQSKREKEVLTLQQTGIRNQKENFDRNLTMELKKEIENITKFEMLLEKDHEIIQLRKIIMTTTSSKLNQGTISSPDYIRDFNNYLAAKVRSNIHTLELIQAKINYQTAKGSTEAIMK